MALITCPDCGKQISDVASSCPSCGRPMGTSMGISMDIATQRAIINEMYKKTVPKKKKGHGCLISILVFLGLFAFGLLVGMSTIEKKPQESSTSMVGEYIDVTEEQAKVYGNYVAEQLTFGSNMRGSAEYRKEITPVLVKRAMLAAGKEL